MDDSSLTAPVVRRSQDYSCRNDAAASKGGQRVAVVLPAYNEELTVSETIRSFHAELPSATFVIVDNNSSDRTGTKARQTLVQLGAAGDVVREFRQGKGNAVRRAFADFDADIYVLADADMTYPAERVHDLIGPVAAGAADLVVGDRIAGGHYLKENKRPFHNAGNEAVRLLVNTLFGSNLSDIMSGYRVLSATFVRDYPILVEGFQLETDMTLHALDRRARILEIPVEYRDRPPGSASKLSTIADGARVVFTIVQILRYYRPLLFFGGGAAILGILGLVAGLPVLDDWISHRYVYHIPLAILAAALEVSAVACLGIGLTLDSINHQFRMLFERDRIRWMARARGPDGRV